MTFEETKKMIGTDGITCIVWKDGADPLVSRVRGVRPILDWIEEGADLKDAAVCDTIVGRAAAMMYVLSGVAQVYAKVMSRGGEEELRKAGIAYEAESFTENSTFCLPVSGVYPIIFPLASTRISSFSEKNGRLFAPQVPTLALCRITTLPSYPEIENARL